MDPRSKSHDKEIQSSTLPSVEIRRTNLSCEDETGTLLLYLLMSELVS